MYTVTMSVTKKKENRIRSRCRCKRMEPTGPLGGIIKPGRFDRCPGERVSE